MWGQLVFNKIFHKYFHLVINFLNINFQNEYGNYQCRYLLVQLDDYSGKTFIIEDNRAELDHSKSDFGSALPTLTLTQ